MRAANKNDLSYMRTHVHTRARARVALCGKATQKPFISVGSTVNRQMCVYFVVNVKPVIFVVCNIFLQEIAKISILAETRGLHVYLFVFFFSFLFFSVVDS